MLEVTLQAVRVGGLREQSAQFGLEAALLALQAADPGREVLVLPDQMQQPGLQANGGSGLDRKSTRLNSSHSQQSRMPSSA